MTVKILSLHNSIYANTVAMAIAKLWRAPSIFLCNKQHVILQDLNYRTSFVKGGLSLCKKAAKLYNFRLLNFLVTAILTPTKSP